MFHFHRIFLAMVGETVNDYVGRRRLERAANLLAIKRELSVTEVAMATGFSSSANFAKAFKLHFGVSPSQVRKPAAAQKGKAGKLFSKYGKVFDSVHLYPPVVANRANESTNSFEDIGMNVKVEQFEEQVACALASPKGYEAASVFETWERLVAWARSHGIADEKQRRFALCYDNPAFTPIEKCRYLASIVAGPLASVVRPFVRQILPAGKYAVAYFKGRPDQTTRFHMSLYTDWLPKSGFEPDDFPLMEHYLNDVRKDGYVEMEVCIKLKGIA